MTRASATWVLAATATLLLGARRGEPQERGNDELCRVFVSVAEGQDDSGKVVAEVEKEIKKKKDWFRLLEEELHSDVHVELSHFGNADELKANVERSEGAAGTQSGTTMERPALLDVKSGYVIEFRVTVLDKFRTTMTASGHGKGQAAKSLAKQIHTICETYVE